MKIKSILASIKLLATLILGVIFPILLIFQSYMGLQSLTTNFNNSSRTDGVVNEVEQLKKTIQNENDYNFVSLIFLENKNFAVMQKKQIMKITIMQLGYAMMSIGLMLIVLGFEDGEHQLSGDWHSFKINFKTGSTGALVVVIGAVMATLGGVLKNDYSNNGIPTYVNTQKLQESDNVRSMYNLCLTHTQSETDTGKCFLKSYEQYISN